MTLKEEAEGYIKRGWPTSAVKMSEEVLRLSEENARLRAEVATCDGHAEAKLADAEEEIAALESKANAALRAAEAARAEWLDTARSEMAGRRAAEAEVEHQKRMTECDRKTILALEEHRVAEREKSERLREANAGLCRENQEWQNRCLAMQTERDEARAETVRCVDAVKQLFSAVEIIERQANVLGRRNGTDDRPVDTIKLECMKLYAAFAAVEVK